MTRGSFFKGLAALLIAPKTILDVAENIGKQELAYTYTEIETVFAYIAAHTKMSRQLMENLPWMQVTLPKLLLRDFYAKEDREFLQKLNQS